MRRIGNAPLIHGFAALHAVVTVLCALSGIPDSLLLTLLTMILTVILCVRSRLSVELAAVAVILVNILGFLLGTFGARLIGLVVGNDLIVHALSTFVTTELLGWGVLLLSPRSHGADLSGRDLLWQESLGWILAAFVIVFILRVTVDIVMKTSLFDDRSIGSVLGEFLSNSLALMLMLALTVLFIQLLEKRLRGRTVRMAAVVLFVALTAAAMSVLVGFGIPFELRGSLSRHVFLQFLLVGLIVEVTLFAVLYLVRYAVVVGSELAIAREKAHEAEFRYMAFKQQVNPHFLFNSLNILDSLVLDGEREDASRFIHELAFMYRYMLQHEGDRFVSVSEELVFARMYISLLQVRFPEGLEVETDVREEDASRLIVPCSLQLLLENTTKHNALAADNPLRVRIYSDGTSIIIENNLIPKQSASSSTGLGISWIRQLYQDAGAEVTVSSGNGRFRVSLPLL